MNPIYIRDLECGKKADERKRMRWKDTLERCFDLDLLPTEGMREEWRNFILYRGNTLSLTSIRSDLWPYHVICRFLREIYPRLNSLLEVQRDILFHNLRKWMLENRYSYMVKKHRRELGKYLMVHSDIVLYLQKIYRFLSPKEVGPETNCDVWRLNYLKFPLRNNPVHEICTLNFTGVKQKKMREEIKRACAVTIRYLAVATVYQQICAVKRFSNFLQQKYPKTESLQDVTREQMEEYLIYLNTEAVGKKSFRSELMSLKSLIETVGSIYEKDTLLHLFLDDDIPRAPGIPVPPTFTDQELLRINKEIIHLNEQIARALLIHQMLANRISETLMLERDCLVNRRGNTMVRVFQIKTHKTCYKPASADVVALIQKSIQYTQERYGDTKYIFVRDRQPNKPMNYEMIQYHLMRMIHEKNMQDDYGNPIGVMTHRFRHSLGKRMTEMRVDDALIAQMLGHYGMGTLRYYRKFGNQALADETRAVRENMDDILFLISKDW